MSESVRPNLRLNDLFLFVINIFDNSDSAEFTFWDLSARKYAKIFMHIIISFNVLCDIMYFYEEINIYFYEEIRLKMEIELELKSLWF